MASPFTVFYLMTSYYIQKRYIFYLFYNYMISCFKKNVEDMLKTLQDLDEIMANSQNTRLTKPCVPAIHATSWVQCHLLETTRFVNSWWEHNARAVLTETEGLVSASQDMFLSIPEVNRAAVSIAKMVIECIMRKKDGTYPCHGKNSLQTVCRN